MYTAAQAVWQTLASTVAGHAVILSLLGQLGDPQILEQGYRDVGHMLSAMGDAARVLQGEAVPTGQLVANLQRMTQHGGAMKQALRALPAGQQPSGRAHLCGGGGDDAAGGAVAGVSGRAAAGVRATNI